MSIIESPEIDIAARFMGNLTSGTRDSYQRSLCKFGEWMGGLTPSEAAKFLISDFQAVTIAVMKYIDYMIAEGFAPNTIKGRLAGLRKLVNFAHRLNLVSYTLNGITGPPIQVMIDTRGPGVPAVKLMVSTCRLMRNRLMVRLLSQMALRRAEILSIRVEELEFGQNPILTIKEKKKADRTILSMPTPIVADMKKLLEFEEITSGPLLLSAKSRGWAPLSPTAVNQIVRQVAVQAGITGRVLKRCHPHGLRHTGITAAAEMLHGDVFRIRQFSRHKDIKTVQVYVDRERNEYGEIAASIDI